MEIEILQERIATKQTWLLETSERVRDSFNGDEKHESIAAWITHMVGAGSDVLKAFHIQSDKRICDAVMVLLDAGSSYREPLLKMLIYRVLIYAHSAFDLKKYAVGNSTLNQIAENLKPLLELTESYTSEYLESLTIEKVCDSLANTGLKEYIAHFKETDIQIVLKAIKGDERRSAKKAKLQTLLNFLFSRILANHRKHGAIASSRHSWWALKDILYYSDHSWLITKKGELTHILHGLIGNSIYFEKRSLPINDIMETTSAYYETVWVLENAIQILCKVNEYHDIFSQGESDALREFIESNIDLHIQSKVRESHLRNVQSDLILLYYTLNNYQLIYGINSVPQSSDGGRSNNLTLDDVIREISK